MNSLGCICTWFKFVALVMLLFVNLTFSFAMQVFNEVSSREMERINVFEGILNNNVFIAVLSSTVIFQFIIIQFLGDFANTTPLTLNQWIACIFIGFIGMPIAAIVKMIPVGST